MRKLTIC